MDGVVRKCLDGAQQRNRMDGGCVCFSHYSKANISAPYFSLKLAIFNLNSYFFILTSAFT
jgi:hypothetical protein